MVTYKGNKIDVRISVTSSIVVCPSTKMHSPNKQQFKQFKCAFSKVLNWSDVGFIDRCFPGWIKENSSVNTISGYEVKMAIQCDYQPRVKQ